MEFKKVKLGEVARVKNGYAFKSKDFTDYGIPIIKIKNICPPLINIEECNYVSEKLYYQTSQYCILKGDILISMTGSGTNQMNSAVGKVGRYLQNKKALQNQRVGKIEVIDEQKYDKDFLYYYLSQKNILEYFVNNSTGSANQANISKKIIENLMVPDFLTSTQRKIANILNTLDSKIEINNKIISNLESQAQAIFKSWFVDFEPFQDGDFVESELGMIPEGWEVKSLSDIAFFKNGLAMQKYRPEINDPSLPVLKIRELNSGSTDFSSDRCRTDIDDSVKVYDGDLIFSWSGTLSCKLWTGGNAGLNQHLFKVTSEKYEKWFNYSWIKFHMNEFIRIAQDKATTMGHIKRSHLDEAKVLIPTIDIYEKIDKLMKPIIELIIKLGIQNTKLAELRDALLPKLMAGEIDVSNIKIEGEEVKNE